jgi:hypothetical protein
MRLKLTECNDVSFLDELTSRFGEANKGRRK